MFDESEHSVQRGSAVDASPFPVPQRTFTNSSSFPYTNPMSIGSINLFPNAGTPTSYLKSLPAVDVQKSIEMFGTHQDPSQTLWGAPKEDRSKKPEPNRRANNKKQEKRAYGS